VEQGACPGLWQSWDLWLEATVRASMHQFLSFPENKSGSKEQGPGTPSHHHPNSLPPPHHLPVSKHSGSTEAVSALSLLWLTPQQTQYSISSPVRIPQPSHQDLGGRLSTEQPARPDSAWMCLKTLSCHVTKALKSVL
jgi:hypothetical protein